MEAPRNSQGSNQKLMDNFYGLGMGQTPTCFSSLGRNYAVWEPMIVHNNGLDDWVVAGVKKVYESAKKIIYYTNFKKACLESGGAGKQLWVLDSKFEVKKDKYEFNELPKKYQLDAFKCATVILPKTQQEISEEIMFKDPSLRIDDQASISKSVQDLSDDQKKLWDTISLGIASTLCKGYNDKDKKIKRIMKAMARLENFSLEKNLDEKRLSSTSCLIQQIALLQILLKAEAQLLINDGIEQLLKIINRIAIPGILVPVDILWIDRELLRGSSKSEFTYEDLPKFIQDKYKNNNILRRCQIQACTNDKINKQAYSIYLGNLNEVQKQFYGRLQRGIVKLIQNGLEETEESSDIQKAKENLQVGSFVKALIKKEKISSEVKNGSEIFFESFVLIKKCYEVALEYGNEAMKTHQEKLKASSDKATENDSKLEASFIENDPRFISFVSNGNFIDLTKENFKPRIQRIHYLIKKK